ncbi:hypothetical protein GJ744_004236 [Endocarpon pusillum]|uniref:Uncharacterized protein n=1 Tax=Endocarpon pusillum TaxID=364733 RepID=A0A8H7A9P0_9EURO|nr:hypothetical protein GJ744_004236 [Endocarpon pusillum]
MAQRLGRRALQHLGRRPAPDRLLDAADVEQAVMQMLEHAIPRRAGEEGAVHVDAVAGQEGRLAGRDVPPDVGEERLGRHHGRRRRRAEAGRHQAARAVRAAAPGVHGAQGRGRRLDHGVEAGGVEELEP